MSATVTATARYADRTVSDNNGLQLLLRPLPHCLVVRERGEVTGVRDLHLIPPVCCLSVTAPV